MAIIGYTTEHKKHATDFSVMSSGYVVNSLVPEFIIPVEALNAGDKMTAPVRSKMQARNSLPGVSFRMNQLQSGFYQVQLCPR